MCSVLPSRLDINFVWIDLPGVWFIEVWPLACLRTQWLPCSNVRRSVSPEYFPDLFGYYKAHCIWFGVWGMYLYGV